LPQKVRVEAVPKEVSFGDVPSPSKKSPSKRSPDKRAFSVLDVSSSLGKPLGPMLTFEQKAKKAVNTITSGADFIAFFKGF